jgi:hypothetical protein
VKKVKKGLERANGFVAVAGVPHGKRILLRSKSTRLSSTLSVPPQLGILFPPAANGT